MHRHSRRTARLLKLLIRRFKYEVHRLKNGWAKSK